MRADAVRTRKLLLNAAAEVFAEQGVEASVAEIAQRAGIGKGTVFRHFATKEDLLAAIVRDLVDGLIVAAAGLSEAEDPAAALYEFMTIGVELLTRDRAFCEVATGVVTHPDVQAGLDQMCDVVETLTDRARRQGVVRADVTGRDIVLLLAGVHQTAAPLMGADPRLWRRYLALVFDGLRAEAAHPLPHPPPRHIA